MKKLYIMALTMLLLIVGCTHIISEKSLALADRSITFVQLQQNPDAYLGKFVILGGLVTGIRQGKGGIQLEIIEYPLDNEEMPKSSSGSGGRFLVDLPPDVGYATFKPGMLVTMAGEVVGRVVRPLDKAEYTYPLIVVKEIHIIAPTSPVRRYQGY